MLPVDHNWEKCYPTIDGTEGFKIAPQHNMKRTLRKKRPWEICYIIIKWTTEEETTESDHAEWSYDGFHPDYLIEKFNFWDWIYSDGWEIETDGVCSDWKELMKIYGAL